MQARFRGIVFRKKFSCGEGIDGLVNNMKFIPRDPYGTHKTVKASKITEEQLNTLYSTYKPINDPQKLETRPPVEYENKSCYYGEWSVSTNLRHGRGIQTWVDGSMYEGLWKNDKANLRSN